MFNDRLIKSLFFLMIFGHCNNKTAFAMLFSFSFSKLQEHNMKIFYKVKDSQFVQIEYQKLNDNDN